MEDLQHAIEDMFDCEAVWKKNVRVDMPSDKLILHYDVAIFDLIGYEKAGRCYAWPNPSARPFIVVHVGEVVDASTAVRSVCKRSGSAM